MATDPNLLKYTYEHYALFPSDGKRHEIVDGEHFVNPAPSTKHQYAVQQLFRQLDAQIRATNRGIVFFSPIDVRVSQYTVVQPDLVVVLDDRKKIVTESKIDGAPNMLVEVVSPGTSSYDRTTKKLAYQRAGTPEYWIVDPIERSIEQLTLQEGHYQVQQHDGKEIALTILPNVTIAVGELWFDV